MAFCSQCGTSLPEGARFCPKCGAETGDAAAAPAGFAAAPQPLPAPGPAPVAPAARGRGGFILPIVIVLALAVIGFMLWGQRDGARPIAGNESEQPEKKSADAAENANATDDSALPAKAEGDATGTTAASLDSAFTSDPQGARARYPGAVTVSGIIATMVSPGSTPSLSLEGRTRLNFIVVNFPDGYGPQLASLAKGQRITVSCRSVTSLAGTTILQDCRLR